MTRVFCLLLCLSTLAFTGCSSQRQPLPPGEIPKQESVLSADEQYGHEVLSQLSERFPLDQDDDRIARVRGIVERLTKVRGNDQQIWHVYVLQDDDLKNAGATRGNFIFIWTGMLKTVESDAELAGILAHEIAHVLAGHTRPDPAEEVNRMISGVAGQVARQAIRVQGGYVGALAGLGEFLVSQVLNALLVNPMNQEDELEADQVGLFILAEAGYPPEEVVSFWERVKDDPDFGEYSFQFLSSHPSSEERLARLHELLPEAKQRYEDVKAGRPIERKAAGSSSLIPLPAQTTGEQWEVVEASTHIRKAPSQNAERLAAIHKGEPVLVESREGPWLRISSPTAGYVFGPDLSPIRSRPQQK